MSHFSKINAEISDEEALKAATEEMGFSLVRNGQCRYYYGSKKTDIVIKLPSKYDVALTKKIESYSISADLFDRQVELYVGKDCGLLMQHYAAEKVRIEAFKRLLAVTKATKGEDIILTLTDVDTGGQINVTCHVGGKIDLKTTGFPGETCMKFQDLETAIGHREEFTPTMEMYQERPFDGTESIYTSN